MHSSMLAVHSGMSGLDTQVDLAYGHGYEW